MLSPRCRYRLLQHSLGRVQAAPRFLSCAGSRADVQLAALRYGAQWQTLGAAELAACADDSFDHLVWDGREAAPVLGELLRVARSGVLVRPLPALTGLSLVVDSGDVVEPLASGCVNADFGIERLA